VSARIAIVIALVGSMALACGVEAIRGGPMVRVENHKGINAIIFVNGSLIGTVPAGATADVPLGRSGPPFKVEARSPSGANLIEMDVSATDVANAVGGAGFGNGSSDDCGSIDIWFPIDVKQGPQQPQAPVNMAACP